MRTVLASKLNIFVTAGVAITMALIPFHAFLSVWAASTFGHYTAFRLWKEFLIIPLFFGAVYLLVSDRTLWREAKSSWILRLMAVYVLLLFALGAMAHVRHQVSFAALAEGLIEDTRLIVFFFIAWVAATRSPWLRQYWRQLVLIPAILVVVFGLLQVFVLPVNFLSHFGYGAATIKPYELVDQNSQFMRVQSTLRGANPLGAYLVVVIGVLAGLLLFLWRAGKVRTKQFTLLCVLSFLSLLVLYFTYSRSAYLGAVLVVLGLGWLGVDSKRIRRGLLIAAAFACMLLAGLTLVLRHNATFEDTFFHTSQLSHSSHSSNQNRTSALKKGIHDVLHEPLGRGPGTAGPASAHNNHPARIAENYFLQIGQEAGWFGLGLFLAINVLLAKAFWDRRGEREPMAAILLASLVGISFVNVLSHAWADDTLAYVWWGLAGIALTHIMQTKAEQVHGKKTTRTSRASS